MEYFFQKHFRILLRSNFLKRKNLFINKLMKNKQSTIRNISLVLLICFNGAFAQLIKQKDSYVVYINYPSYTIKTSVSNSTKKRSVNEELTYHWYSSNKIMETKGDYDGKLIDGLYTSFYLNNNLKEKGDFKKGLKHGKWISWYESGKINEITHWSNGRKSGSYKKFNEDESLNQTATYKNDKLNGLQTIYNNGEIATETKYKNGKEVIKKQKQQTKKEKDATKERKSIKEKISSLFKKKQKQSTTTEKDTKTTTEKKPEKKKRTNFFKKKDTPADAETPVTKEVNAASGSDGTSPK